MNRCDGPTPSALPLPPANDGGLSKNSLVPSSETELVVVPNWLAARNDCARKLPFPRIAPSGLTIASTRAPAAWLLASGVFSVIVLALVSTDAIGSVSAAPPVSIVTLLANWNVDASGMLIVVSPAFAAADSVLLVMLIRLVMPAAMLRS